MVWSTFFFTSKWAISCFRGVQNFLTHFSNVKKQLEKIGFEKVLPWYLLDRGEGSGESKAIWAMPIYGNNTFQKGVSLHLVANFCKLIDVGDKTVVRTLHNSFHQMNHLSTKFSGRFSCISVQLRVMKPIRILLQN